MKLMVSVLYVLGYGATIVGGLGMIVLTTKFSFVTTPWEHQLTGESFLGMSGQTVWRISWWLIIGGTALQMAGSLLSMEL